MDSGELGVHHAESAAQGHQRSHDVGRHEKAPIHIRHLGEIPGFRQSPQGRLLEARAQRPRQFPGLVCVGRRQNDGRISALDAKRLADELSLRPDFGAERRAG